MNSLFDPECHRQVLGNRQEPKEQKARGKKEVEEGELVLQGGPGSVGQNLLGKQTPDSMGARTEVPSTSQG